MSLTPAATGADTVDDDRPAPDRDSDSDRLILFWQILFGSALLGGWEALGRQFGHAWTSLPSLIAVRLVQWAAGDLALHVATTATETLVGLVLGALAGVAAGLALGRMPVLGTVLRPIIVAFYSVPLITLAPLLILWFGLDMTPKIVLVTVVTFFLIFFNTFTGVRAVDEDLIAALRIMGSDRREEFRKVLAPAAMAWILSGMKIALPYALSAATTGELLAARHGLGSLLAHSASQFDMTGLYAALLVLMVMGILISETATLVERRLLRWRHGNE